MKISISRLDDQYHMEARNKHEGAIRMNGNGKPEGIKGGLSPLQLLLAGIGGCSAIDIIGILDKQRQDLEDIQVVVDGNKQKEGSHSVFKDIHLHFIFTGELNPDKVERAINLSLDKYCSVSKALEKTSEITHSYEIKD